MFKAISRKINSIKILIIILLFIFGVSNAGAADYPHFDGNNVGCESCHFISGTQPSLMPPWTVHTPTDIDDTQFNALCWSCHNDVDAAYVKTHSSLQTDNGYGDWTIECKVCHNPHYQRQFDTYGSASYIYSGESTGVTETTLTKVAAGWTVNAYQGLVVVPNTSQKRYKYRIANNTADTLTIEGPVDLTKAAVGNTFAIIYGKLTNSTTVTPNSGSKAVRLYNPTGTNSFADGNATYDGVCEVCHTQTTYHRNTSDGDHSHNAGTKCTTCHLHTKGFKVACDYCHGYPPVVNAATGGPDGLANNPGTTGSSKAGAHDLHVNTEGYTCAICHYESVGLGATHNSSLTITMGYSLFSGTYQGGIYDGQSGVNYDATTTTPATTVSNTGTKTCSNIYCHSTGQSTTDGNSSTPAYASPVWDNPSSGACGTCHKVSEAAGLTSGSHAAHLGTTGVNGCGDCHTGASNDASSYDSSNHINASINVSNSYTAGGAPGNGYGTCSAASCHDDGTGSLSVSPEWGTSVTDCTECHAEIPATGSHHKHLVTTNYNKAVCGNCHGSAVQGTTAPAQHQDGNIDVYDTVAGDLGYPQNVAKGGAPYDSCSTAYCHSTGQSTTNGSSSTPTYATVTWGGSATCGTCHKVTEAAGLTSGSHAAHLGTTGVNGCGDCHTGTANNASSYNSINHVDGNIDVDNTYTAGGAPGNGYGTCSTASCHDDGTGLPAVTPVWGTSVTDCSECHANVPATGSHQKHVVTTNYKKAVCRDCHNGAVQGTTAPAQHQDGNLDVYYSSAGDLGYPQNKAKGSAYSACSTAYCHSTGQSTSNGSSSTPTYATVTWGGSAACGTCHKVTEASGLTSGSHAAHLGTTGVNGCGDCHTGAANNASSYNSTNHIDGQINVSNSYSAGGEPGNGYGTCTVAACHGSGSPTWGTDFTGIDQCTKCHGTPTASPAPDYAKAPPKDTAGDTATTDAQVGAHQAHLQSSISNNVACNECHTVPSSVSDAGHIQDDTPGTAEITFGALASNNAASPVYSGGECSSVYCHGGAMPGGSTDGADRTPEWNNTNYISGSAANDCSRCHGYPPANALHSGKVSTDCITCHDSGVNAAGTGFTDASTHINGTVNISDDCYDCHSSSGGATPGTTPDAQHAKHVQTAYVGKVSQGDYGKVSNGWYAYANLGGVPNKKCGYCHPQSSATHMNGVINLNFDPSDTGAVGTMKAKNNPVQSYTQVQRVSVTCSSVYCHSSGYFDGSTYQYKTSPNWYGGTFTGDKCDDCHGNMPDTSSHMSHGRIAIHYDSIYNGTGGLISDAGASGAGHGDENTSTTINCNLCHNNVVKMAANDKNTTCAECHSSNPVGTMVIDPSATSHVTGTADINFAAIIIRSKAQLRDDITTVTELNTYWERNNGYKQGASSYDSSKATLADQATYSNGTCSAVACHNGLDITWNTSISSCRACHTDVPRTDQ